MSVSVKTVFVRATGAAANPTAEDVRRVTIPAAAAKSGAFEFVCDHVRRTYALPPTQPLAFKYRDEEDEWITVSSSEELCDAIAAATAARPLRLYISAQPNADFAALNPASLPPTPAAAAAAAPAAVVAVPPALTLPAATPNSKADIKAEPVAVAAAAAKADSAADLKVDAKGDAKSAPKAEADDDGFLHVNASDIAASTAALKPASPAKPVAAVAAVVAEPAPAPAAAAKAAPVAAAAEPEKPVIVIPVAVTPIVAPVAVPAVAVAAPAPAVAPKEEPKPAADVQPAAAAAAPPAAAAAPAAAASAEAVHEGVSCDGCGVKPIRGIRYNCVTCPNFDLCAACERDPKKHPVTHAMLKIRQPIDYAALAKRDAKKPAAAAASAKPDAPQWKAEYESDVTIPDGSKVVPDRALHKVWRIRNSGAAQWPAGTSLAFVGGEVTPAAVQPADLVSVPQAKAGQSVDVGAYLQMPQKPGRCTGYYRLQLPATHGGAHFGPRMWIDVLVVPHSEMPNAPAPDAAAAPAPAVADVKVEAVAPKPAEPKAAPAPAPTPAPSKVPEAAKAEAPKAAPVKAAAAAVPAGYKYAREVAELLAMGFKDSELIMYLLSNNNGDVNRVVNWMLQNAH